MLSVTRRSIIKEILLEENSVSVSRLAEKFDVTEETIRRDLKALESDGFLKRTYGGAFVENNVQMDAPTFVRKTINIKEKNIIAKKASELINAGDSVFIDFSTTASFLSRHIANKEITVLTNSLFVANTLSDAPNIELIVIGGIYNKNCNAFLGNTAIETIEKYYVDKVFMSCRFLSIENGITDYNERYAAFHSNILKRGKEIFLLADHNKFNKTSFIKISNIDDVDTIITDEPLDDVWDLFLSKNQMNLIKCDNAG